MSRPRRCLSDLSAAPGDEHRLLELCPCLLAQCNLCRGTSSAVLAPLLFWLVLGFQVVDLREQKMAESNDHACLLCILPAGDGLLVTEVIFQVAWARKGGGYGKMTSLLPWPQWLSHLTHLHLEQLFPTLVLPEPVQLDQRLSLQPGSLWGRCGRVVQMDIQGIAVLIQHPRLERKWLQIP